MEQSHIDLSDIRLDKGKRKLFRLSHTFKPTQNPPTNAPQKADSITPHIPNAQELQSAHNPYHSPYNPYNPYPQATSPIEITQQNPALQTESSIAVLATQESKNHQTDLNLKDLRNAFFIVFTILALALPKIFLSTQIYYASKEVAQLQTQHDILSDENRRLKHQIESFRYQFMIEKH